MNRLPIGLRPPRRAASWLLVVALACVAGVVLPSPQLLLAQDDGADPVVAMVVELLKDTDRDMRNLGLQQVRGEAPGEAATKQFAALLPDLPAESQAALLEALGERGDAVARPAVLEMFGSDQPAVRAAAMKALESLGSAEDVPLLARHTVEGSEAEKSAAGLALRRLRGEGVDDAVLGIMKDADPPTRTQLLGVLASRNAKQAMPQVLEATGDEDAGVRLAAIGALRLLADEGNVAQLVDVLKASRDDAERRKATLALLGVCSRGREACAEPILAGMADATPVAQVALLQSLGRAGGAKALEAVVEKTRSDDADVRDEAVRTLAVWSDPAAVEPLLGLAEQVERYNVLAVRGLVGLAAPAGENPGDLATLVRAMELAKRIEEKRLVLGAISHMATAEALDAAAKWLDDADVAEEAATAVVLIVETMPEDSRGPAKAALAKAAGKVKNKIVQEKAQQVLKSL